MNKYPTTEKIRATQIIHGTEIQDDYAWLEGDDTNETNLKISKWTENQNNFTRSILDQLPNRKILENKLKKLLSITSISTPVFAEDKIFYFKREKDQEQPSFFCSRYSDLNGKLLLDPKKIDNTGLTTIAWAEPSPDGELVAYGTYKGGDENYCLEIITTNECVTLPEKIEGKVCAVSWLNDGTGFIYSKLADIKNPYSRQIKFHMLGTNPQNDPLIFEQLKEGPLATTWGPYAYLQDGGKWLVLGYHTSTKSNDLWIADFMQWQKTGELKLIEIVKGLESRFSARILNDELFVFTNQNAPNGCIYKASIQGEEISNKKTIVAESQDLTIVDMKISQNSLLVSFQKNACSVIHSLDFEGNLLKQLQLPGYGSAYISANENRKNFFLSYVSFNMPKTIFHYPEASQNPEIWYKTQLIESIDDIEVTQKWATSKDGTKISMFVIHKQGIKLNSNNPTVVYGYGGFNISLTPSFSPTILPWLADGGVYAVTNLRGGGEYGEKWHSAGILEKKASVFEDFEACVNWLIDNKYTNSNRIAIMGGSNGGLLTGAALTRKPDLYAAVVCAVPLLDMLKYHKFLMAKYWVPEYGSSEDKQQFKYLIDYSPYHNIKPNKNYPATFFISGENDTRVHPMHARKMAAALQSINHDPNKNPILLWIDRESGHGQGKPLNIQVRETTDKWMFIRWQLKMETKN